MKKINFIKKIGLAFLLLFGINAVNAQSEMAQLLKSGTADANLLIGNYANPFLESFGSNLNNGWYSTAAPLKLGRFTITIAGTASFIPTDKQSFTINPADYSNVATTGNLPLNAPTIFGATTPPAGLYAHQSNSSGLSINTPMELKGMGVSISPFPVVQLSVGLIKGTEVMLRVFPKVKMGDNKAGFFGIGVKHEFKQWIPALKDKPFNLSFIAAFTKASFDLTGTNFLSADSGVYNPSPVDYSSQSINFSSTAWNMNVVISKKFSILTLFGGVRLSHYSTTLDLKGNYPITVLNNSGNKEILNIVDPISLNGKGTKFGINGGLRIKLGFMAIFAEGSFVPGGYSSATAGLNLGFFN